MATTKASTAAARRAKAAQAEALETTVPVTYDGVTYDLPANPGITFLEHIADALTGDPTQVVLGVRSALGPQQWERFKARHEHDGVTALKGFFDAYGEAVAGGNSPASSAS